MFVALLTQFKMNILIAQLHMKILYIWTIMQEHKV